MTTLQETDSTPTPTPTPTPAPAPTKEKQYPVPKDVEDQVVSLVKGLNESNTVPIKLKELSAKYDLPTKIGKIAYYGATAYPKIDKFVLKCMETWKSYEKYDPADLIPAVIGFFMAFFWWLLFGYYCGM